MSVNEPEAAGTVPFSALMERLPLTAKTGEIVIPPDWMQGRSAFGGLQVALLVRAMRLRHPGLPALRSVQVVFVAPVPQHQPLGVEVALLRRGRSAVQLEGRLRLGAQTLCLAAAVFGATRDSVARKVLPTVPPDSGADDGRELSYLPGFSPAFMQHFSMRWLLGGWPFSGAETDASVIALAHRDDAALTEAHVVALADAVPPAVLSTLSRPAPASSLTWTLEFLAAPFEGLSREGWRMDLEMTTAADGYTQQSGVLRSPKGEAVALSRQTTVVFA